MSSKQTECLAAGVWNLARNDPEVVAVLESAGLGDLAGRFAAEDVDASVLWSLGDADLRDMGLTLGQRKRLLARLEQGRPGAPPSRAAEPEFRRLTVLFSDLVGFTELATRLDPDELLALLQTYRAAARDAARLSGGFIASLQGDGVVMLFGFPTTQSSAADRAISAAHALMAEVSGISHRLADGRSIGIAARIGIASGRAIVSYPEDARSGEPQMVGPVINRAARLQAIAASGAVVVDEQTRALSTAGFVFADLPDAELRGFAQKVPVAQAMPAARPAQVRAPSRPSVGTAHEHEWRALAAAWQAASAGQPVLAVVTGEAGIGKSTLADRLMADVADSGARILSLSCTALTANTPLRAVVDLLEAMLGAPSDAAPGVRLGTLRQLLASSPAEEIGAVSALLGLSGRRSMTGAEGDRRLLLNALSRFLLGDGTGPVLIVIEDVHWADPTTRELLLTCAQRAAGHPLMMLATSRDGSDALWSGHAQRLHLVLSPLAREAAEAVMSHHLADREWPEWILQTILTKSDGNPLMIEALTRSVEGWADAVSGQAVEVPASIYESISAQVETLGAGRKAAAALAVFDEPTEEATLALALGLDEGVVGEMVLELVDAGIAERFGSGLRPMVRLRHNLYREVCYERLVKSAREGLHRAVFAALNRMQDDIATRRPGHMAWHALEGGDYSAAAPLALAAGEQALQGSALIEASHFLRLALVALDRLPPSRQTDQIRLKVLIGLSSVSRARQGIASDEVGALGRQVLELARSLGETRSELIALNGLYTHALVRADYAAAGNWAKRLHKEAVLSQDPTFVMIGTRARGVVALHTGALEQAVKALQEALDSYDEERHLPLTHLHGYDHAEICAAFLSFAKWLSGDPAGGAAASSFSVSHSRRIDHKHSLAQALIFRAMLMALANEGLEALASGQEAGELGRRHALGAMRGAGGFLVEAGRLMVSAGAPTAAELQSLRLRFDEFRKVNPYNYQPLAGALLARLHMAGSDLARAREALDHAEAVQNRTSEIFLRPELMRIRAQLARVQGDTAAADETLRDAFADAERMGARMLALRIASDIAEATPANQSLERLRAVRVQLSSEDGGWDIARCRSILGSAS